MIVSRLAVMVAFVACAACFPLTTLADAADEIYWELADGKGGHGHLQERIAHPLSYFEQHYPDIIPGGQEMMLAWRPVEPATRVSTKRIGTIGTSNVYDLTYTFPPVLEAGQLVYQRLARVLVYEPDAQAARVFYVLVADRPIFDDFRDVRIVRAGGRDVIATEHRWSGNALNIEQHYYLIANDRAVDLRANEVLRSTLESLGKGGIQIHHRGGIFRIEQLRYWMRTSDRSRFPHQELDLVFAIEDNRLRYVRMERMDPEQHFLARMPRAPGCLWRINADLNADQSPEALLTLENQRNGQAGHIWQVYVGVDGGFTAASEPISFRTDAVYIGDIREIGGPGLLAYQPGSSTEGALVAFQIKDGALAERRLGLIRPRDRDADIALYQRYFGSPKIKVEKKPIFGGTCLQP
jgi:hypothetical protein